nr:PREDICTED: uncharacterized protein LOC109029915 [Bemisia tabaci]
MAPINIALVIILLCLFQNSIVETKNVCTKWWKNDAFANHNCYAWCADKYGRPTPRGKLPNGMGLLIIQPPFAKGRCVSKKCVCYVNTPYRKLLSKKDKARAWCIFHRLCKKVFKKLENKFAHDPKLSVHNHSIPGFVGR